MANVWQFSVVILFGVYKVKNMPFQNNNIQQFLGKILELIFFGKMAELFYLNI